MELTILIKSFGSWLSVFSLRRAAIPLMIFAFADNVAMFFSAKNSDNATLHSSYLTNFIIRSLKSLK